MESKRKATSDLNHENWDRDEEPEEKGTFQTASEEVLKNRVIKKAKRNLVAGEPGQQSKSIFSGFSGFGSNVSTQSASSSPFAFLSKLTPTPPSAAESTTAKKSDNKDSTFAFEKSGTYYEKLKLLNQAFSNWIKMHVDKNPLCILSPIFKDYEKYLKEIQDEFDGTITSSTSTSSFKFGETAVLSSNAAKTDEKAEDKPAASQFTFGKVNSTTDGNAPKSGSSIFGNSFEKSAQKDSKIGSFTFKVSQTTAEPSSSKSSIFSSASSTSGETTGSTVTGFSFTAGKPFTFGSNVVSTPAEPSGKDNEEAEEDDPPKVEFTPVVEEDSVYSKRCKVFVKHDGNYADRGVGTLYLKPVKDTEKTQLLVRADTNLGNILLNFILNESIPAKRLGKNNVMMVCIPTPEAEQKPTSILLRVKTGEEADELLSTINKHKK